MRILLAFCLLLSISYTPLVESTSYSVIPETFLDAVKLANERAKYFSEHTSMPYKNDFDFLNNLAPLLGNINPLALLALKAQNINPACYSNIMNFVNAFNKGENWTYNVLDAFGKPGSGVLQGNLFWAGEYRQCISLNVASAGFQGKYCGFGTIIPGIPSLLAYGMCVSDKCSNTDVQQIINLALAALPALINVTLPIAPLSAEQVLCREPKVLDTKAIVAIFILSCIGALVLIGTLYDIFKQQLQRVSPEDTVINMSNGNGNANGHASSFNNPSFEDKDQIKVITKPQYEESLILRILLTFSAYTNAKKIFHVGDTKDQLTCLHAIRFMSLGWVILGHTFFYGLTQIDNSAVGAEWVKRFSMQLIINGTLSVDTFFLLSGLLTSYLFLKETNKPGSYINIFFLLKYYLHRIWRLTPPYMLVIMISATLTNYFGNGPYYSDGGFDKQCKESWWTNLLYINNLVKTDKMCLGVSWYLANDMQFHWIAPFFLLPVSRGNKFINVFGIIFAGALIVTHILSNALILKANPGIELGIISNPTDSALFFDKVYIKPYTRVAPFAIGLLVGYLIYLHKTSKNSFIKLNKVTNTIGWIVSLVLLGLIVFGLYPDTQGNVLSQTAHIMYRAFAAVIWAVALGFIIFSCISGYGGAINEFLSLKFWTPLSRLTFSSYLIHTMVMLYYYNTLEKPYHLQDQVIIYYYIAHLVLSFVAGFFVSIFFELPMIGLEKFVFGSRK